MDEAEPVKERGCWSVDSRGSGREPVLSGSLHTTRSYREEDRLDVGKVPFRPVPARNMIRELPHWTVFVIYKVTLACGVVGFGETMQYYTWCTVSDAAIG